MIYLSPETQGLEDAAELWREGVWYQLLCLYRRHVFLGWLGVDDKRSAVINEQQTGLDSGVIYLPAILQADLGRYVHDIEAALELMEFIVAGNSVSERLQEPAYWARFSQRFQMMGSSTYEGDAQEIETVMFEAMETNGQVVEDLWAKWSWLSLTDDDCSLRCRFSFGLDHFESVADDLLRQRYAAQLCEAMFPEAKIITENAALIATLKRILGQTSIEFVERIVYFNAPNGGATFHHDVERGHLGVLFAQLKGRTAWLALSKHTLDQQIALFVDRADAASIIEARLGGIIDFAALQRTIAEGDGLATYLGAAKDPGIGGLINEVPEFVEQLVAQGHGYVLEPGDAILLPQHDIERCAWHSVFCVDDVPGHALSFAIRGG